MPEISTSDLGHLGRKSRIGDLRPKNGPELTNFVIPAQNPRRFASSGYHGNLRMSRRNKKNSRIAKVIPARVMDSCILQLAEKTSFSANIRQGPPSH
jgi:hypothetical protein